MKTMRQKERNRENKDRGKDKKKEQSKIEGERERERGKNKIQAEQRPFINIKHCVTMVTILSVAAMVTLNR